MALCRQSYAALFWGQSLSSMWCAAQRCATIKPIFMPSRLTSCMVEHETIHVAWGVMLEACR